MTRESTFDKKELRLALGSFLTGVTVVTTCTAEGQPKGLTANSFSSVSLEPPLVLVCIGMHAGSYDVFNDCSSFAINILSEDQQTLSSHFATGLADKFSDVDWQPAASGCPLFETSLAWFDCQVHNCVNAGDHIILIGRIQDFAISHQQPLGYFRGNYLHHGLEEQVIEYHHHERVQFGVILEENKHILLTDDAIDGQCTIPLIDNKNSARSPLLSLQQMLKTSGYATHIHFVYSVFRDADKNILYVIYRGELESSSANQASSTFRFYPLTDIPWQQVPAGGITSMLSRYLSEYNEERFGVYVDMDGVNQIGCVAMLDGAPNTYGEAIPKAINKDNPDDFHQ